MEMEHSMVQKSTSNYSMRLVANINVVQFNSISSSRKDSTFNIEQKQLKHLMSQNNNTKMRILLTKTRIHKKKHNQTLIKVVNIVLNVGYDLVHPIKTGFARPVIIHRAIVGSLERFIAILCEHSGGKWDFWISPRQLKIIPISKDQI